MHLLLIAAGFLASHPPYSGCGFLVLPLLVWMQREARLSAPWYVFLFFLGVGLTIPFAVVDVGEHWQLAITIWAGYALVAGFLTWVPFRRPGPFAVSAWTFGTLSIPALGFVFVAPPTSAAGWWFPGTATAGLALTVWAGAAGIEAYRTWRAKPLLWPLGAAAVLNAAACLAPPAAAPLTPVSLEVPQPPRNLATSIAAAVRLAPTVKQAWAHGAQTVVLPENVLGIPSAFDVPLFAIPNGHAMLAGGVAMVPGSDVPQKGAWLLPQGTFYPALQPIPAIEPGLRSHWSALGKAVAIDGAAYSLLVCFEASTSLPAYHLRYGRPIILIGNGWWDHSGIMDIEAGLGRSWARLFRSDITIARGLPRS
ncbi:hypothetical protein [Paraburkholderia youngii]|uniref:hypothetical protein n=1 Tax=Paraburkholderia youngii TaxID=2782701 RepID=UPI003D1E6D21